MTQALFIGCCSMSFTIDSSIIDAISKACLKRESDRISKRLAALIGFADEIPPTDSEYQQIIQEIAALEVQRKRNQYLRKMKNEKVGSLLHRLWINRIRNASRSTAGRTIDPMSLTMPVPPTNESAKGILIRGRKTNGTIC